MDMETKRIRAEEVVQTLKTSEKLQGWMMNAVETTNGRYDFRTLCQELMAGLAQLWLVFDQEGREAGLVITDIRTYPTGARWLNIRVGTGNMIAMTEAIDALIEWATEMELAGVEGNARPGWTRIGAKIGFKETHRFLEKETS